MTRTLVAWACVGLILVSLLAKPASAQEKPPEGDLAPEADRQVVTELVREVLAKELATVKLAGASDERHKIEKKIRTNFPKFETTIVTYWRSSVSAVATVPEPAKRVTVAVPKMVRGADRSTITLTASAPLAGNVSGRAMTDDRAVTTGTVASPFSCTLTVTAECVVTRDRQKDKPGYRVEVKSWTPVVKDVRFGNDILDALRGEVEKAANQKLAADSDKLRGALNAGLKKAYEAGKLKLSD